MKHTDIIELKMKGINFVGTELMFIYLNNGRTVLVPLNKFPEIRTLSENEKVEFEIIDEQYLSFLSIDKIYKLQELIGINIRNNLQGKKHFKETIY